MLRPMMDGHTALLILALIALGPGAPGGALRMDSLAVRLTQAERSADPRAAGEAALMLGRLHYARGDYRPAADAFSRAAARLAPARKGEALYWAGLSWLGLGSNNAARAALDEVVAAHHPRRAEALLGIASAWESDERYDKALSTLQDLLAGESGEAGPAALERMGVVAGHLHRTADAERAHGRLLARSPGSMEAAALLARTKEASPAAPLNGPVAVEAGRFTSAARARGLVARAQRAGYKDARVVERGSASSRSFSVRLGTYPDRPTAREAQSRAAKELGLSARVTGDH